MKTKPSATNPFGPTRHGFLWEVLAQQSPGRHLDYGAYDGAVIDAIARAGIVAEAVGVDLNAEVVAGAANRLSPTTSLHAIDRGAPLPFADAEFDSASLLDVIEHVVDQRAVVSEIQRVLRPGGLLVVTVPQQHAFSWLDVGNWKFHFPRIHRAVTTARHGRAHYVERYEQCANGLFGDIEVGKDRHQHFDLATLTGVVRDCGFVLVAVDGSGLYYRPLSLAAKALPPARTFFAQRIRRDARKHTAANLFTTWRRV